jgi:hypothetical protein
MSVSISEPHSRARLKKFSAEFDVGIENGVAIERERARLKQLIESRVFRGVKK